MHAGLVFVEAVAKGHNAKQSVKKRRLASWTTL